MSLETEIKKGFAELKQEVTEGVDGLRDEFNTRMMQVEAEVHTARPEHVGGARGKYDHQALPESLRKHVSLAEAEGRPDPAGTVAFAGWWQAAVMAQMDAMRGLPAERWIKQREAIEKGWRYDAAAYAATVKAAMGEVAGGGANIIALPVEAEIRRMIRDNSLIRRLATEIAMTGPTVQLPVENANLTFFVIAETGLVSDAYGNNTTGFAQVPLIARKFGALVTLSNELLTDNIIGLQDYLFTGISEAIGIGEDQAAIEGLAGGVNFSGLESVAGVNSFSVTGNTSGGDVPVYPDLVRAVYLANHRATRDRASWVMRPKVFRQIAAITDTQGQPVFHFANVPNVIPERILGYPVTVDSALTKTSAIKSGSESAYFGPFNRIVFGSVAGVEFALDPYGRFDTYQTRLRVIRRTGVQVPTPALFTILRGISIT